MSDFCIKSGQKVIDGNRADYEDRECQELLNEIQRNFNYICKESRISNSKELGLREMQLDIIKRAFEASIIENKTLSTKFLSIILKDIAIGISADVDLEELLFE